MLLCGYASKKAAGQYAEDKHTLTDDDFVAVYRDTNPLGTIPGKQWRDFEGAKTTKHFTNINADKYER